MGHSTTNGTAQILLLHDCSFGLIGLIWYRNTYRMHADIAELLNTVWLEIFED